MQISSWSARGGLNKFTFHVAQSRVTPLIGALINNLKSTTCVTITIVKLNRNKINFLLVILVVGASLFIRQYTISNTNASPSVAKNENKEVSYWFELQRKSNIENLYKGVPGDKEKSTHVRSFRVKTGIPGERPTPLPQLVGRDYWVVTEKHAEPDNPETAPYFITLDVPVSEESPYGPVPYEECNGQCDWILPGAFGLHGTGGNPEKLADWDPGSSGCIRHTDEEITYLYDLLEPDKQEIRYYVVDK